MPRLSDLGGSWARAEAGGLACASGAVWLAVVLDSQWSSRRRRRGWRTSSAEVGHRDLWEQSLWLREQAGEQVQ